MSAMAEAKASGRRNPGKVAIPEKNIVGYVGCYFRIDLRHFHQISNLISGEAFHVITRGFNTEGAGVRVYPSIEVRALKSENRNSRLQVPQ